MSVNRVSEIVNGRRGITADTALRLAYDLQCASRDVAGVIARDVRPRNAA